MSYGVRRKLGLFPSAALWRPDVAPNVVGIPGWLPTGGVPAPYDATPANMFGGDVVWATGTDADDPAYPWSINDYTEFTELQKGYLSTDTKDDYVTRVPWTGLPPEREAFIVFDSVLNARILQENSINVVFKGTEDIGGSVSLWLLDWLLGPPIAMVLVASVSPPDPLPDYSLSYQFDIADGQFISAGGSVIGAIVASLPRTLRGYYSCMEVR